MVDKGAIITTDQRLGVTQLLIWICRRGGMAVGRGKIVCVNASCNLTQL